MSWTPEKEQKLRQLWKKGHSGSQIANMLGEGATRNSVLGKAFRLKLETRAATKKTMPKTSLEKNDVILLENLRFYPEEKSNNKNFAKNLASFAKRPGLFALIGSVTIKPNLIPGLGSCVKPLHKSSITWV